MAIDLTELQKRMEAIAGLSVSVTEGDDDWDLRSSFLNRAQRDWSERYDWPQLYAEINSMTSRSTGNATIAMPTDFRKLAGEFKAADGSTSNTYAQVDPFEVNRFGTADKYSYILGDPANGYNLIVHASASGLGSGVSISFPYYKVPASLVSGSDVSLCPNPNYLVQQGLYYYFLANEDERFQSAKAEAEQILANMLEFETVKGVGYHNEVLNVDETKHSFKWGRD